MKKDYLKLKQNETIAFIAPAGCIADKESIDRAKLFFEQRGYKVVYGEHLFGKKNYMSGSDEERLFDLHWAFEDNSVDAIICARGGYGCLRLVEKIDYELISRNKKLFCGYSDITVLSAMFLKRAGLVTYSGPMVKGDFGGEERSEFTMKNFFNVVCNDFENRYAACKTYRGGDTEGILFGGNLASVVSLCGVDFLPDEGFIFFAEDLNEPVYKIDKMFTQLLNMDKFRANIRGIVLGDFLDCGYPKQIDELFCSIGEYLQVPVMGGFKITHSKDKITLPYGSIAKISDGNLIY